MAKKRSRGKLGKTFNSEENESPSTDDIMKMLEETEGKVENKTVKKSTKVKIGTQVDSELYQEFRSVVKEQGMKLGFVIESLMKKYIQEKS